MTTTEPTTVTVHGTYTRDEIPPRCRNPRRISYDATVAADIPVVPEASAPVAFRVTNIEDRVQEIRAYNGTLYCLHRPHSRQAAPTIPGDENFPFEVTLSSYEFSGEIDSHEAFEAAVRERMSAYMIIDGVVWAATTEPAYEVTTFGLGHNHGGTGLMTTSVGSMHPGREGYFRADEFEAARAHAIEVARERGDTEDVARFTENGDKYQRIEVLLPEEVTLVTLPPTPAAVRDLRFEHSTATHRLDQAETPEEEAQAFQVVANLRARIIGAGYTPVRSQMQPYEARTLAAGL